MHHGLPDMEAGRSSFSGGLLCSQELAELLVDVTRGPVMVWEAQEGCRCVSSGV